MDSLQTVLAYHEATKHHPQRFARSPGYMDWANQPDPFRRFEGAPVTTLKLLQSVAVPSYDDLYAPEAAQPSPLSIDSISEFFRYSLALSAWKEFKGSRWALRINPSSGNLHPTEGYAVVGPIPELKGVAGVFHFAPREHALEQRCSFSVDCWGRLVDGFPPNTFFIGLSSIHWREAWKYGERAYRYCQHDVGHALAALSFSAAIQGWRMVPMSSASDQQVETLLGLGRDQDFEDAEREYADALIAVVTDGKISTAGMSCELPSDALEAVAHGDWQGKANRLSRDHVDWGLIDGVADACVKPLTRTNEPCSLALDFDEQLDANRDGVSARQIVFQRRSAVAMDGRTSITAGHFYLMIDRVLPRFDRPPWNAMEPHAHVHLGLFVHRVDDLEPGLYFLVRNPSDQVHIQQSMRQEFEWSRPDECPPWMPLYRLKMGDARTAAGQLSCGQEIAADGAFSLGMFAAFDEPLRTHGAWFYRRLFFETGMIGQVLYLEAEAAGVRATGIGCFFDDLVHDLFGLKDTTYQSLYHFTVGGPVDDARLTTLPAYPSLNEIFRSG